MIQGAIELDQTASIFETRVGFYLKMVEKKNAWPYHDIEIENYVFYPILLKCAPCARFNTQFTEVERTGSSRGDAF